MSKIANRREYLPFAKRLLEIGRMTGESDNSSIAQHKAIEQLMKDLTEAGLNFEILLKLVFELYKLGF